MSYHELYVEKGSGPAVVFSHGTLMDATMFAPQIDYLAERGYRAIAYNSRVLTGEPGTHSLDDLAEDCRQLLDRFAIDKCCRRRHVRGRLHGAAVCVEASGSP